jgi:hypothetical protein
VGSTPNRDLRDYFTIAKRRKSLKTSRITRKAILYTSLCLAILVGLFVPAMPVAAATVNVHVSPSSQAVSNGAIFSVNIDISTDTASRGWQLNVNFDASKMTCNSVVEGGFLSSYATAHGGGTIPAGAVNINNTTGLVIVPGWAISGAGTGGPTGTGTLCTLNFTAKPAIDDYASIDISDVIVSDVNGTSIPGVTVTGGQVAIGDVPVPDLIVFDITATAVTPGSNDYNISYTIKNQGNLAAGASSTRIVIDGGAPITIACSALNPASETTSVIGGPFTLSGGSDTIVVTADVGGVVAEGNEGNNVKTLLYALVGDEDDTAIRGNPQAIMVITAPDDTEFANLNQGSNTIGGTLNVKCNTNWQVSVSDDDATTNGHMTEWNGTTYLSKKISTPMNVRNASQIITITLAGPGIIAAGNTDGQSGDAGENFAISFDQVVQFVDWALSGGKVYRIVVTFTGAVTF